MNRITQRQLDRLTPQVRPLLAHVARAARAAGADALTLVCGLAEGADRHVARLALDAGYRLHAVLPFARERYERDFHGADSHDDFDALLARAERVTELPGREGFASQAYHRAGEALLEQSHLLLAVWDGEPALGPGGTAEVVNGACHRRMPIVHVSTRHREAPTLIWRRQGLVARGRHAFDHAAIRRCGPARLNAVVSQVVRSL